MPIQEPIYPGPEPDWGDLYEYAKEAQNTMAGYRSRVAELEAELDEQCEAAVFCAKERDRYREALEELSCLGNGDRPGNSTGNLIALRALKP